MPPTAESVIEAARKKWPEVDEYAWAIGYMHYFGTTETEYWFLYRNDIPLKGLVEVANGSDLPSLLSEIEKGK